MEHEKYGHAPVVTEIGQYHQDSTSPPPPFPSQSPPIQQPSAMMQQPVMMMPQQGVMMQQPSVMMQQPGMMMQQPDGMIQHPQQAYGYNQQQPQMAYSQPQHTNTMPMSMPAQGGRPPAQNQQQFHRAIAIPNLGMGPAPVDCPNCSQRCMTNVSYHAGNTTHVWAGITFCFTGCLCFIPYMMNSLKDVQHRCGSCGTLLATWHKSGQVETHMHA